MQTILSPERRVVAFDKAGSGPPLVLVHGAFSDHRSNWEFVRPLWALDFTTYAVARPGRGGTPAAPNRALEDDSRDVLALIDTIGEPDLRALRRYRFRPDAFFDLDLPVLLQIGTESPRHLYATDALRAVLPNARIGALQGQAHEGMTTAPHQYAKSVRSFLLESPLPRRAACQAARPIVNRPLCVRGA
jgi:pimeloyl-ACP methyl ester carboxylesterase